MSYYEKYLKYKTKYIQLNNLIGGNNDSPKFNNIAELELVLSKLSDFTNLQSLTFDNDFNQPLGNSFDKLTKLQTLSFGHYFNQPLDRSLDKLIDLRVLTFGNLFNKPLGNSLDRLINLQTLNMTTDYNLPINDKFQPILKKFTRTDNLLERLY